MVTFRSVKASERMPDSHDETIFRDIKTKIVYNHFHGQDDDTIYFEGRNDDIYVDKKTVEWFEEIPSLELDILAIIKWTSYNHVHREGKYWMKDYSSIAYSDETIVKAFLNDQKL